jgi:glycosyltransferase involved in cell wall biosynthesis
VKRTVLLIRNAAKDDFGGAETYQVSLAKVLAEDEYAPVVVTGSTKLATHARKHDIETMRGFWWPQQNWSGKRLLLFPAYVVWQVILFFWYVQLIHKTQASVLHIQSKDDFIAGTLAGRFMGKQVIWTDHMDLRYIFRNIARPFRNPVGKLVFWSGKFAHHIIIISDNEYRLVTSSFKNKNALSRQIVIIKNGVLDQYQKYHAQNKTEEFVFCLASRIVENKGIGEAISAFEKLQSKLPDNKSLRLKIYGDGPDINKFKASSSDNAAIEFYGHQTDALRKVSEADVFMLPSYQEGFSIALLEACMLGKAIIATDVDSNPELIHDMQTGLLVRPKDPESLSEAMDKIVCDTKLQHLLETNTRRNFQENFDLETIVKAKIIPLYND